MRVLVTGGNGYVGRALTRQLVTDHEVAVLDNLRTGKMRLSADDLNSVRFYKVDLRQSAAVAKVVNEFRPEAIVHLAAIHFIPECESKPAEAIDTNVTGTVNLLQACLPETRFVFASTAAVYAPEDRPHREDASALAPMDVYGLTKIHAEEYLRYWTKLKGLDSVIVRLFNVIGPGETNPHILPAILAQALKSELTLRLGNCHPKRDYIDVRDAAAGFSTILEGHRNGEAVEVVNLGTGNAYSVYDLVAELGRVANRAFAIETNPDRVRHSDRPFLAADTTKIRMRYGWAPRQDLTSSLQHLWQNPDIPIDLLDVS